MNIYDFAQHHGLKAITRRHFAYNKQVLPVDNNTLCTLIYSRTICTEQLGLSGAGSDAAVKQCQLLAQLGILPKVMVSGIDLRNVDGARLTAAAIAVNSGKPVPCIKSPAVTYPYYDATATLKAYQEFGDQAVHMYLAEKPEVAGLWTEPASVFEARITAAISANYPHGSPVLFDLNFEQMTMLHFLHVEKISRLDIPTDKNAWCPTMGGGIAYGTDGAAMEFTPEFEMIIKIID